MGIQWDTDLNLTSDLATVFWVLEIPSHHESVVAEVVGRGEKEEHDVDKDYVQAIVNRTHVLFDKLIQVYLDRGVGARVARLHLSQSLTPCRIERCHLETDCDR